MKRLPMLLFCALLSASEAAEAPRLTSDQASQIAVLVLKHEKIAVEFAAPITLSFDRAKGVWSTLILNGLPHDETVMEIRDRDAEYRLWKLWNMRKPPEFHMSPRLRPEIRRLLSGN